MLAIGAILDPIYEELVKVEDCLESISKEDGQMAP